MAMSNSDNVDTNDSTQQIAADDLERKKMDLSFMTEVEISRRSNCDYPTPVQYYRVPGEF